MVEYETRFFFIVVLVANQPSFFRKRPTIIYARSLSWFQYWLLWAVN